MSAILCAIAQLLEISALHPGRSNEEHDQK